MDNISVQASENQKIAEKTAIFSVIGNIFISIIKGAAGYFGNSYALIADAIESTTDVFSSFLVLFGLKFSSRPADENHPYGHGRAESLVALIVSFILFASAILIIQNNIVGIFILHKVPHTWTLLILAPIIIWKEIIFQIINRKSKITKSSSLKAEAWHHRSDAITSVAAFIGISIAIIFGENFAIADNIAAIFAACFIIYNSYKIFRPAISELMDEDIHDDLVAKINNVSLTVKGIINTEKCFVRKAGMRYHVDLHVTIDANTTVKEGHRLAHEVNDILKKEIPELGKILVHIEPN